MIDTGAGIRPARVRMSRVGAVAALVAGVAWSGFLLDLWWAPAGFETRGFVSELSAPGAPGSLVYRAADLLAGVALLVLGAVLLRCGDRSRRQALTGALVGATGLGGVVDAVLGMSCAGAAPGQCAAEAQSVGGMVGTLLDVHTLAALVEFAGTGLGPVLLGVTLLRAGRPRWGWASVAAGALTAGCGLADLAVLLAGADVGVLERVRTVLTSAWLVGLAIGLLRVRNRVML